jgi:SAM-dependent methyltransferase
MTRPTHTLSSSAAENYERYFVPAIALPFSGGLLGMAALREGERVLDVACGTGVIARLAADQVGADGAVVGIDVSPDMIGVARGTDNPGGAPVEWRVGDAGCLPFEAESFDVVLCQMGLMFMADRAAVLAEMHRVLRPDGRVVVNTPGAMQPPFAAFERVLVENVSRDAGDFVRAVFSMSDPDALGHLLRDAGIRGVAVQVSPVRLELAAPADFLWQYINLTPLGTLVADVPEDARQVMERQAVEAWQPYVLDGTIRVEQPALLASGIK